MKNSLSRLKSFYRRELVNTSAYTGKSFSDDENYDRVL